MKNLFNLSSLSIEEITAILDRAQQFADGEKSDRAKGKVVASLFFEPSTRTQNSYSTAVMRLGGQVLTFNSSVSSMTKGETFYDTVKVFESLGCDAAIIRDKKNEYWKELEGIKMPILSGGDGTGNHPTQSLLDLLTIRQEFGHFDGLKVCIVGDIIHSRVAHTDIEVMERLGMEVYTSGPDEFKEEGFNYIDFDKAIKEMDVIMLLRIQHERLSSEMIMSKEDYNKQFGLNKDRVRAMKPNAIIMHPAPFNRGVEIDDDCVECEKSRIFKQMSNGVFVRMAVVERSLLG
ncbi:MAG: aspartate carbamoyltransferase catalytic subunit [Oscillospiraceae bacterium]|nr:aspartate carbamoyltransferase catalytic subunit [Oscillospiraceae bacterium]MDY4585399.1 aspartate carbamoyltransferase catalytic subunit [Oscillospiraceae bacterium]